jgi:ABC-type transport system involved in multi-copper enzyme maturation permease subunit
MNALRIAGLTFREAIRRKALYGAVLVTLAFLVLYAVGTHYALREFERTAARTAARQALAIDVVRQIVVSQMLLAGLFAVSNIGALLAIFTASSTVAQEVEQGTLHAIVPKPLRRWEVVAGKWLGNALMLAIYVAITGLTTAGIIYARAGHWPAQLPLGLALIALKVLLLLALTVLGSTLLPALATGIVAFILYVAASVGGMIEQLGALVQNETMQRIGVIASLVIPSDAMWKMAAAALQPSLPLTGTAAAQLAGPFGVLNPPSGWMALYALVYLGACLVAAAAVFARRDL